MIKPAATETFPRAPEGATAPTFAVRGAQPPTVVVTSMRFGSPARQVWDALMFYEQIDEPPPLYLRLLLPVPIRTEGSKSAVGDEALCLYEGGHLVKRVTQIDPCRFYGFDVCEQNLAFGGLVLSGGSYVLRELPGGGTEVEVTTRYVSPKRPRWLWERIEASVCHMFHRHLLRAIRRKAESG
jgi:hypothetical protein